MAYPLVTALVVLPTASSGSVMLRTSFGSSAISAMPPALSVIGPYASSATMMPVIDSIDVAATAMPYRPANLYAARIAMQMATSGQPHAFIDTAMPAMMLVACPVVDAFATYFTGANW